MKFKPLALEDKEIVNHYLAQSDFQGCDYSFANLYIWADAYQEQFAITDDMVVFRGTDENNQNPIYMYPAGCGDFKTVLTKMFENAHNFGSKLTIRGFTKAEGDLLEEYFPGKFTITTHPEQWDYLYLVEDLWHLSGSRYHSKRNHIAQFKKHYPNFSYEPITEKNIHLCYDFSKKWYDYQLQQGNKDITLDKPIVKNALDNYFQLSFTGGLLFVDNKVVAFTVGEPLNSNTYVVHIEKALPYIKGAYPMINQLYVQHNMADFVYVNREEDDGIPGLIKAKKSYRPVKMIEKCIATEK